MSAFAFETHPLPRAKLDEMAYKRTRSAAQRLQLDGDSSNVTDYLGPYTLKRQKRDNEPPAPKANSSARVTGSSVAAHGPPEEPPQQPAPTRRQTRQHDVNADGAGEDEDEGEDGSVLIDHNQISSAINQARQGSRRTVNAPQIGKNQLEALSVEVEARDESAQDRENEEDSAVNSLPKPHPKRHGRLPKSRSKQNDKPYQQIQPSTRLQAEAGAPKTDAYQIPDTPARVLRPKQGVPTRNGTTEGQPTPPRHDPQRLQKDQARPAAPAQYDEEGDVTPSSEGEDGEEAEPSAVEDSAFIEAPRPDKNLSEVEMTINSFGGIIKALGHAAWTGRGNQGADFESRCENSSGRALMKCIKSLYDLLVEAIDVRSEEDTEAAYEMTTDYLRDHGAEAEKHIAGVAEVVDKICSEKLAPKEHLTVREVRARKSLLRDVSQRLIPASMLIIEKACDIGPSDLKRGKIHLTVNFFTLQFLLRSVAWAKRLVEALTRGLENWPIDDEFTKNEEDLDDDEFKSKYGKKESRENVKKKILALCTITKEAARTLADQEDQATKKRHQEQLRRKKMIRQRELWNTEEQKKAQEIQQSAQRWGAFCTSMQALKSAPDPMKQKWDRAEEARRQCKASQVSAFNTPVPSRAYNSKGNMMVVSRGARYNDDEDPFAINEDDDWLATDPTRNRHASGMKSGVSGSGHGARPAQASAAWDGLDWTKEEEIALLRSIRYYEDYSPASMARRLKKLENDVARKAALFKATYRDIYVERGAGIPNWAL